MFEVKNEMISLLSKLNYFHVHSLSKNSFVLTSNMAALSPDCKPRIDAPPNFQLMKSKKLARIFFQKKFRKTFVLVRTKNVDRLELILNKI